MILARGILGILGLGLRATARCMYCVHILVYIFTANWKLVALVAGVWLGALSVAGNIILFVSVTGNIILFPININQRQAPCSLGWEKTFTFFHLHRSDPGFSISKKLYRRPRPRSSRNGRLWVSSINPSIVAPSHRPCGGSCNHAVYRQRCLVASDRSLCPGLFPNLDRRLLGSCLRHIPSVCG
jgi:hypothetical protein